MKFCVMTDLHYDTIPDGDKRIEVLLRMCREKNVDFIIDLGDLCHPIEKNRVIIERFRNSGIPIYFTLGNHDLDHWSNEVACRFLGLEQGCYSVQYDDVKFVFLDADYRPFGKKNKWIPYLSQEKTAWLREQLTEDCYFVICTHQSLVNNFAKGDYSRGVENRESVRHVLEMKRDKILFCINGHDHGELIRCINGIWYYGLNSASHFWQNVKDICIYDDMLYDRYPNLKNMVLYREPLHIIVTIDEYKNVIIEGMNSEYCGISVEKLGIKTWNSVSVLPKTSSLYISKEND